MVEFACTFPVDGVVTTGAIARQLAIVLVLVTRGAGRSHSEKRLADLLQPDGGPFIRTDVLRVMTLVTGESLVFAGERESGLAVIE